MDLDRIDTAIAVLGLGNVTSTKELPGGHAPVFRVDLSSGKSVILKVYLDDTTKAPDRDSFAAAQLKDTGLPVTRYLLVDDTKAKLPFRFAVTNYLAGVTAGSLSGHQDITSLYRQTGELLRSLHAVAMPAYGSFGTEGIAKPVSSNGAFMRGLIDHSFERFAAMGAESVLTSRLRQIVEDRFEEIVPHSHGPVFAHDDMHPNNILGVEDSQGNLVLSGLIDFGNARAADAVFDLAKCLFCSEHDAPGSTPHILAGYGKIKHPDPEGALSYYTLLHRMVMWWWLRQVRVIPAADAPSELMDDLRATANKHSS